MGSWWRPFSAVSGAGLLVALLLASGPAVAGTVHVRWSPVDDPLLSGYRVFYGTAPGSYSGSLDVGTQTETVLSGLADCVTHYVAVKSLDDGGMESGSFSPEVAGFPRPSLTAVTPGAAAAGLAVDILLEGMSFEPGLAVTASDPGIGVSNVVRDSCSQARARLTIPDGTFPADIQINIVNPGEVPALGVTFTIVQELPPADVANLRRTDTLP